MDRRRLAPGAGKSFGKVFDQGWQVRFNSGNFAALQRHETQVRAEMAVNVFVADHFGGVGSLAFHADNRRDNANFPQQSA